LHSSQRLTINNTPTRIEKRDMINSQTAAGLTIELPGYGYELPAEGENEV
jgi:hypothetical protein